MNNILLLILIVIVLFLIIRCVNTIKNNTIENLETQRKLKMNPKSIKKYVNETIRNALAEQQNNAVQGAVGPRGERGEPGGVFLQQGMIQNVKDPNKIISRNNYGVSLKDDSIYTPNERWTLRSDGKLLSRTGDSSCLSIDDDEDNSLIMTDCSKAIPWDYDNSLAQIRPRNPLNNSGKPQCLTLNEDDIELQECKGDFSTMPEQSWMFR